MLPFPRLLSRAGLACAAVILLAAGPEGARAQGKPDAPYTISMTVISIGNASWMTDIGTDRYTAAASGRASGIFAVPVSGEGLINVEEALQDGRLLPTHFTSTITRDDEKSDLKMTLDNGKGVQLDATKPAESADRVPVTEAHRQGIIDPISAMLIPVAGSGEMLTQDACRRTLPIFDGRRRYDLALSFKRMDKVKAAKGYQGASAVCAVTLKPIAGYRNSSLLVKYLTQGREIELSLAPNGGTRVLAPFRLSIATMVGNMVVQATRFDTGTDTALRASVATSPQPR